MTEHIKENKNHCSCTAQTTEQAITIHEHEHSDHLHDEADEQSCCSSSSEENVTPSTDIPAGYRQDILYIKEMDCPMESKLIERVLADHPDVAELRFNYLKRELYLIHKGDLEAMIAKIKSLNMTPQLIKAGKRDHLDSPRAFYERYEIPRLILAGVSALIAEIIELAGGSAWISAIFALLTIVLVGLTTYKKGWIALKNRTLNINALMSVAVTGAFLLGIFPEAAMVIFLFTLSELIEARSLTKAQNAVEKLLKLAPDEANVITELGVQTMQVDTIPQGSLLRIAPGERLPLDGMIIRGHSSLDESAITGESMPVDKSVDSPVYAGSINLQGEIDYRTTSTSQNSTLAKIIQTIEAAQVKKAPVQRFIDRFAAIYTPIVFLIAIAIALFSPVFGVTWFESIYKALVVLIIACPCALVISTPVAIVSALTQLARHGILVKGGEFIEKGAYLTHLAFDKTGTLTMGRPVLDETFYIELPNNSLPSTSSNTEEIEDKALITQLAVSLAARSDHPISKAIVAGSQIAQRIEDLENKVQPRVVEIEQFTAVAGHGTKGQWQGHQILLGNRAMMMANNIQLTPAEEKLQAIESLGASLSLLAIDGHIRAIFAVADPVKENAATVIQSLQSMGITPILLSGDHQGAVNQVAEKVGIREAYGALLPEDKLAHLTAAQQSASITSPSMLSRSPKTASVVGMIGDGINDAPALAQADIGFAMGAIGSDISIETANVAIMDDDLAKLPYFLTISRKTLQLIQQNIFIALGIKVIFFLAILFGYESMWAAVFADVGASLIVIGNSLRILKMQ